MKDNNTLRGLLLFGVLIAATVFAVYSMMGATVQPDELSYNEFLNSIENGEVAAISIVETKVTGLYIDSDKDIEDTNISREYDFVVNTTNVSDLEGDLESIALKMPENSDETKDTITVRDLGIQVTYDTELRQTSLLASLLPFLVVIVILIIAFRLFMKQVDGANNKSMSFGKSRAKEVDLNKQKITFENVAGAKEEKEELEEIVEFLKDPKKFIDMGARIPKGVLLMGPPGTGKTLLARAVAGEAKVPFFTISGSDFVEMYVGVGASRVRDLFGQAKKAAPAIIFIDEIDAVGRHRGSGLGGGHDEREQTLNQLLVEMDGFATNEGIIVIAATNRADILDNALLRPGRFDRRITVSYPDVKGREEILKVHAKNKPMDDDVDFEAIAKLTPYSTGADLENMLNEAAILSARKGLKKIPMDILAEAIGKVQMGPEKKSRKVTEKDLEMTAYHEAGHAILANALENCDPVHEVSIIPRSQAGGYTRMIPKGETMYRTKASMFDYIVMGLGGYVMEELKYGDITTGASGDIKSITETARQMVTVYGMNDEIGPVYLSNERDLMIGREIGHTRSYSDDMAAKIDKEVHDTIMRAKDIAVKLIKENMGKIDKVVEVLLEKEKIDGDEFRKILA